MYHRQSLNRRTIANWRSRPWRPDSNKRVSGEPGAVQKRVDSGCLVDFLERQLLSVTDVRKWRICHLTHHRTLLLPPAQFCPHQPESCSRLCETACLRPNPGQGMAAPMGHTRAAEAASWTWVRKGRHFRKRFRDRFEFEPGSSRGGAR